MQEPLPFCPAENIQIVNTLSCVVKIETMEIPWLVDDFPRIIRRKINEKHNIHDAYAIP